jgi:hypothetical protein
MVVAFQSHLMSILELAFFTLRKHKSCCRCSFVRGAKSLRADALPSQNAVKLNAKMLFQNIRPVAMHHSSVYYK